MAARSRSALVAASDRRFQRSCVDRQWPVLDIQLNSTLQLQGYNVGETFILLKVTETYILAPWEVPEPTDTAWFSSGPNGIRFDHQGMNTICTSDVRNLPIRRRGCLFMDENIASAVSPVYSQKACKMQCRLKMTIEMCQCAPYFFPIPVGVNECDLEGMLCIRKYSDVILSAGRQDKANSNCHCPSLCEQTTFSIALTKELEGMQCLLDNFHFPLTLVQYKRQILFSDMDLLVSFGGIINLFLGLSLLSSVEVVYYLMFRLPSTLWRQRALDSGDARTSGTDPMGVFCTSERWNGTTMLMGT
uniref:Uncharacterized protein n=1 Tax=Timema bartmani TaxID=61472 RepID=A0A7R9EWD7_9NEOP|nr:unnamed protein product [Timema bartmani]